MNELFAPSLPPPPGKVADAEPPRPSTGGAPEERSRHLLEALPEIGAVLLGDCDFREAVVSALGIFAWAAGMHRVNLIENIDRDGNPGLGEWQVIYEWSHPGVIRQFGTIHDSGSNAEASTWFHLGSQAEAIVDAPVAEIPDRALRELSLALGTKYLLGASIHLEGRFWGWLAMDDCRTDRVRTGAEKSVISAVARIFALAIVRERRTREREAARAVDATRRSTLLGAVASASEALARHADLREGIVIAAGILGDALGVDRFNVIRYDHERAAAFLFAEWCRGTISGIEHLVGTGPWHFEAYEEVFRPLMDRKIYTSPTREKTGANAVLNMSVGTLTDLFVPIFVGNVFWGAINLDDCTREREWTDAEVDVLRGAAQAIAAAVHRERAEREHREAIARERLAAARRQVAHLSLANNALQRTIDEIARTENMDELVPAVLRIVGDTFRAKACVFFEISSDETVYGKYWLIDGAVYGPAEVVALDPVRFGFVSELGKGFRVPPEYLFGETPRYRRRAVVLDHATGTAVADFDIFARNVGWECELNVPVTIGGQAEGTLCVYRGKADFFSDEEIALAETLAAQLGLAVAARTLAGQLQARAVEAAVMREREQAVQERVAELARTNDILRAVNDRLAAEADPDAVLPLILREACRLVDATEGVIYEYRPETNALHFQCGVVGGEAVSTIPNHPYGDADHPCPVDEFPAWRALLAQPKPTFTSISLDGGSGIASSLRSKQAALGLKVIALSALTLPGRPRGLFGLGFRDERVLSESEIETFNALAQQATLALHLSRLAHETRQAAVAREQESATLVERNRIAREIHDTLGQSFTGVVVQLQAVERMLRNDPPRITEHLARAIALANGGLAEARRSIRALRPLAVESVSLTATLQRMVESMTRGTPVIGEFSCSEIPDPLSDGVATELLRCAQEAVTNALRHAEPRRVRVVLDCAGDGTIRLSVTDDGRGFDPEGIAPGLGLTGMRERVARIGASLTIDSGWNRGTTVTVTYCGGRIA